MVIKEQRKIEKTRAIKSLKIASVFALVFVLFFFILAYTKYNGEKETTYVGMVILFAGLFFLLRGLYILIKSHVFKNRFKVVIDVGGQNLYFDVTKEKYFKYEDLYYYNIKNTLGAINNEKKQKFKSTHLSILLFILVVIFAIIYVYTQNKTYYYIYMFIIAVLSVNIINVSSNKKNLAYLENYERNNVRLELFTSKWFGTHIENGKKLIEKANKDNDPNLLPFESYYIQYPIYMLILWLIDNDYYINEGLKETFEEIKQRKLKYKEDMDPDKLKLEDYLYYIYTIINPNLPEEYISEDIVDSIHHLIDSGEFENICQNLLNEKIKQYYENKENESKLKIEINWDDYIKMKNIIDKNSNIA